MLLYHGSNVEINEIDLSKCHPHKDFGTGFYLTEIKEQAQKMAARTARLYGGKPIVTVFEIKDDFLHSEKLSCKNFGTQISQEWAIFVMNNRNRHFTDFSSSNCNLDLKFDVVAGPVANDDMTFLFRQFENDFIDFETLVRGLTFRTATNQYSFHTERALTLLRKKGVLDDQI